MEKLPSPWKTRLPVKVRCSKKNWALASASLIILEKEVMARAHRCGERVAIYGFMKARLHELIRDHLREGVAELSRQGGRRQRPPRGGGCVWSFMVVDREKFIREKARGMTFGVGSGILPLLLGKKRQDAASTLVVREGDWGARDG